MFRTAIKALPLTTRPTPFIRMNARNTNIIRRGNFPSSPVSFFSSKNHQKKSKILNFYNLLRMFSICGSSLYLIGLYDLVKFPELSDPDNLAEYNSTTTSNKTQINSCIISGNCKSFNQYHLISLVRNKYPELEVEDRGYCGAFVTTWHKYYANKKDMLAEIASIENSLQKNQRLTNPQIELLKEIFENKDNTGSNFEYKWKTKAHSDGTITRQIMSVRSRDKKGGNLFFGNSSPIIAQKIVENFINETSEKSMQFGHVELFPIRIENDTRQDIGHDMGWITDSNGNMMIFDPNAGEYTVNKENAAKLLTMFVVNYGVNASLNTFRYYPINMQSDTTIKEKKAEQITLTSGWKP